MWPLPGAGAPSSMGAPAANRLPQTHGRNRCCRPGHSLARADGAARYPALMGLPLTRTVTAALAAVLFALGVTQTANAATMNVARRVEPSLDPYLFTTAATTSVADMTAAQKWLATNIRPLVLHDSDPRVSEFVNGWAQRPYTAAYYNGTGVNPSHTLQMQQAKDWLVSKDGKPVMVDGGWRMLDLRVPAARMWWLYGTDGKASCNPDRDQRAALDLLACGYSGLWLDNALTTPTQGFTPTPDIDAKSWASGVLTTLKMLKARKPKGTFFTINMHWTDTSFGYDPNPKLKSSNPVVRAARLADQVIIEGGAIDAGLHYPLAATVPWSYRRLLNFADAMHKQRTKLQWEMTSSPDLVSNRTPISGAPQLPTIPSCRDSDLSTGPWKLGDASWRSHVQGAAFNFATAVLTFKAGDSVGDMCEYPDRGWAGYSANLGKATGKRIDKGGLLWRKLQRGVVVVNPNDTAKRAKLPKAGVNYAAVSWPVSSVKVSSVVIPPRSAAVVGY